MRLVLAADMALLTAGWAAGGARRASTGPPPADRRLLRAGGCRDRRGSVTLARALRAQTDCRILIEREGC